MLTKNTPDSLWAALAVVSTPRLASRRRVCRPTIRLAPVEEIALPQLLSSRPCPATMSMESFPTSLLVTDILVMISITAFTLLSFSYCYVMWRVRHDFLIAMRSPLLSCGCGSILALRAWSSTLEYVIAWGDRAPTDDGIVDLIGLPAMLVAEAMAIVRAVRVLLMYYPEMRKKWGRIPKEKATIRALLYAFALMEIVVWSGAAAYGIPRAGDMASSTLAPFAVLTALAAGLWLGCKLGRVDDMCGVGRGSLFIGAFMLGAGFIYGAILMVPMSKVAFKYAHVALSTISYTPVIWTLVIAPIRQTLRYNQGTARSECGDFCLLCGIIPWRNATQTLRIAVAPQASSRHLMPQSSSAFDSHGSPLEDIMSFAPLREAFGEFCRKALCKESFDFLVAVSDFKFSLHATPAVEHDNLEGGVRKDYDRFMTILEEYVECGAHSEVNIDSHARQEALMHRERAEYVELSLDQRAGIFFLAEREVSQLLAENLLSKFRASAAFRELVDDEKLQGG